MASAAKKKAAASSKKAASKKAGAKKTAAKKGAAAKGVTGRPTKYTDDMPDRLIAYFNVTEAFEARLDDNGKTIMTPAKFPTLARFAVEQGVCRDTLHHWATEKGEDGELVRPAFSDAYARAKDFQEALLVEGGMAGAFQHTFAVFTAKNILGWSDKQDLSHTSPDGSMSPRPLTDFYPDDGSDGDE